MGSLLSAFRDRMREPECINPGGHHVGEQDPNGGWWCSECDTLFTRPPRGSELGR